MSFKQKQKKNNPIKPKEKKWKEEILLRALLWHQLQQR
jgi:hypothetical protein